MTKNHEKKPPTILEQADLAAFVALHQHTQPKPFLRESDHRVCFEFLDDIGPSIQAFYQNENVGIADYIKSLKHVRSAIFSLKGGANHDR